MNKMILSGTSRPKGNWQGSTWWNKLFMFDMEPFHMTNIEQFTQNEQLMIPPLCQEMHFRLIGRKKFFTQAEWSPSPPQASKQRTKWEHSKKEKSFMSALTVFSACLPEGERGPTLPEWRTSSFLLAWNAFLGITVVHNFVRLILEMANGANTQNDGQMRTVRRLGRRGFLSRTFLTTFQCLFECTQNVCVV